MIPAMDRMLTRVSIYACTCKHDGRKLDSRSGMTDPFADRRISWAVGQIQDALARPLTIAGLASAVNLSPSRFRHLFAAQTGLPPAQYLQRARLRRARLLIDRTFLSVKEVMALVGYSDPSHFARDFRRMHGRAPSEIRGAEAATPLPGRPLPSAADVDQRLPSGKPLNYCFTIHTARPSAPVTFVR